jgi:hypothetical protein
MTCARRGQSQAGEALSQVRGLQGAARDNMRRRGLHRAGAGSPSRRGAGPVRAGYCVCVAMRDVYEEGTESQTRGRRYQSERFRCASPASIAALDLALVDARDYASNSLTFYCVPGN